MSRHGLIIMTITGAVVALALSGLFPGVTHCAQREKTLEERVAALEKELASRPRAALVDLEELITYYKKTADLKKRRMDFINRRKNILETVQNAIEERKQKQERMPRDSTQWWKEEMEIVSRERELAVRWRQFEAKVKQMQMQNLEEVYKDIVASIRKYASEKGINLVFWKHGDIDEETWGIARREGNLMSHRYMIDIRPILHVDDSVDDITNDVKKILAAE